MSDRRKARMRIKTYARKSLLHERQKRIREERKANKERQEDTDTLKIKDVYDCQQRSERQKKSKNETKDIILGRKRRIAEEIEANNQGKARILRTL